MKTKRTELSKVIDFFESNNLRLVEIVKEIDYSDWFEDEDELSSSTVFRSLCRTIVGQQLSNKAARAIYSRFIQLVGENYLPSDILKIEPDILRGVGLSWAKVRSVKDLSEKVETNELKLDDLLLCDNELLISELSKVKGIGRWTAEMFLMFKLCREDIFSWGDLGLKKGLIKFLEQDFDEEKFKKVVESWSPYRTYGAIAMWHLLDNR